MGTPTFKEIFILVFHLFQLIWIGIDQEVLKKGLKLFV